MEGFAMLGSGVGRAALAAALWFGWADGAALRDGAVEIAGRAVELLAEVHPLGRLLPVNFYTTDPNVRMEQLLRQSEDLRQMENEWRQFWLVDQPAHLMPVRVHGGIGP